MSRLGGDKEGTAPEFSAFRKLNYFADVGTERFSSSESHSCPKLDFILPVSLPSPCLLDMRLQHSRPLSRLPWCLLSHQGHLLDLLLGPSSPASLQPTCSPSHCGPSLYAVVSGHLSARAAAQGQDRRSYFICFLPEGPSHVRSAFSNLAGHMLHRPAIGAWEAGGGRMSR